MILRRRWLRKTGKIKRMYKIFPFVLFGALLSLPAQAGEEKGTPAACRLLSAHSPAADVAYAPGTDVYGRPVVPADLDAVPPLEIPDVIRVPLSVDLAGRIRDNPDDFEGVQMEAPLGMLEIHKDGRVTYNGQDWTASVHAACGKGAGDGHKPADSLQSSPDDITGTPPLPDGAPEDGADRNKSEK